MQNAQLVSECYRRQMENKIRAAKKSMTPVPPLTSDDEKKHEWYITPERRRRASMGVTSPEKKAKYGPAYINMLVRSKDSRIPGSEVEESLDDNETYVLWRYLSAALVAQGRVNIAKYNAMGKPEGRRPAGMVPFNGDQQAMIAWYVQIQKNLQHRTKCGLQALINIWAGEDNGITLEHIGRAMTRSSHPLIIKGGYLSFVRTCIQDIVYAEQKLKPVKNPNKRLTLFK